MTETNNEFGVIGLGRMGGDLVLQALEKGMRVVDSTRKGAPDAMLGAGLVEVGSLEEFKAQLDPPRVVLLYIPAGPPVDQSSTTSPSDSTKATFSSTAATLTVPTKRPPANARRSV